MFARADMQQRDEDTDHDHIVRLHDVSWEDYERVLAMRGDRSAPRITYLEGELEIMSPSRSHEVIKSFIACMVEAWCLDHDVEFSPVGSWTIKERKKQRGAEPDECYIVGVGVEETDRPHLAIEVVWTSGGIDKLEVYRKLGVGEVWYWKKGRIQPYALRGEQYEPIPASEVLRGIDLDALTECLAEPTASAAIRAFRRTWQR